MIISHKYKFIFIKTKRTAGTSIEIALSRLCGDKDIITPVGPADEKIRKSLGIRGPQHYLVAIASYKLIDWIKYAFGNKKKFNAHMSAERIRNIVGKEIWDNYYKFCFVRNPWDRVISLYYYHNKTGSRMSISEYINSGAPFTPKKNNALLYMINGDIAVDKICYFENIDEELDTISSYLGFPERLSLPKASSRTRNDKRHYREILSREDSEKIARAYSDEINMFKYAY